MMDGVSTIDTGSNAVLLQMNVESIAEVRVLTSNYQVLSHPAVTTVIPGMRRRQHVESNVRAAASGPCPPEILDILKGHRWKRNFYS
jgi:aryl-alcohol dehydrogenase-like predicted oxidoreductase